MTLRPADKQDATSNPEPVEYAFGQRVIRRYVNEKGWQIVELDGPPVQMPKRVRSRKKVAYFDAKEAAHLQGMLLHQYPAMGVDKATDIAKLMTAEEILAPNEKLKP